MASATREVVTLQIGHYANFVGTHWWNIQESSFVYGGEQKDGYKKEINHDVLWREGVTLRGEVTYTPRLVAVDLKGSLKTLKQDGRLYDLPEPEDDLHWSSDVTMHKMDSEPKNEFLEDLQREEDELLGCVRVDDKDGKETDVDASAPGEDPGGGGVGGGQSSTESTRKIYDLDDSVTVWSDFLRTYLHPKSLHIINQYHHNNEMQPFHIFGCGKELLGERSVQDELEDRMHFFLEECDQLQGLHLLVDTHDGFSGLGCGLVEQLADDYSSKSIMTFGVSPATFNDEDPRQGCYRLLNSALSYQALASYSSLFVPLSLSSEPWRKVGPATSIPHLNYKPDLMYHTSAILATSLDTATLPYRLDSSPTLQGHFTDALTALNKRVAALNTSLPFPIQASANLIETLLNFGDQYPWQSLTPRCNHQQHPSAQSVVMRGISSKRSTCLAGPNVPSQLSQCTKSTEVLDLYLNDMSPSGLSASCALEQACNVVSPYPHLFDSTISVKGDVGSTLRPADTGVESVPVMTSLQSTPSVGDMLEKLHQESSKINIRRFPQYNESGLEDDDFKEILHSIKDLAQCYNDGSENEEDDDD